MRCSWGFLSRCSSLFFLQHFFLPAHSYFPGRLGFLPAGFSIFHQRRVYFGNFIFGQGVDYNLYIHSFGGFWGFSWLSDTDTGTWGQYTGFSFTSWACVVERNDWFVVVPTRAFHSWLSLLTAPTLLRFVNFCSGPAEHGAGVAVQNLRLQGLYSEVGPKPEQVRGGGWQMLPSDSHSVIPTPLDR